MVKRRVERQIGNLIIDDSNKVRWPQSETCDMTLKRSLQDAQDIVPACLFQGNDVISKFSDTTCPYFGSPF